MSMDRTRRGFLADVGRGALVATVGSGLATDLGLASRALAADGSADRLTFGAIEPLVAMMQETSRDKIVAATIAKLQAGTPLRDLLASAALANARTFGGEDYVGFHTIMALAPAYHMASELPESRRALPVLKVIYRNTSRIQEFGGPSKEVLHTVEALCCLPEGRTGGEALRDAVRAKQAELAEKTFANLAEGTPEEAFNELLFAVQDNTEVHRTVLPYRSWDLLGLIGREQAHTLLRQSVRYCVKSEREWGHSAEADRPRVVLPKLLDQYKLVGKPLGTRNPEDGWIERLSRTIFEGTPDQAADAAAAALAEGFAPNAVGQALSLAANQLILRDEGRQGNQIQPNKPAGSVHGDSIGVHACDSANAWRNMAAVSNPRNTYACLILGAYQVARDRVERGGDFLKWTPRPRPEDLDRVQSTDPDDLIGELRSAVRGNDQARACAVTQRYLESNGDPARVFELMLGFAVSEDGSLHAEKFYRTTREEFASTRPAFRGRQLVALARVTASEFGRTAPGYAEACALLKV
jgi:hypothetical protein